MKENVLESLIRRRATLDPNWRKYDHREYKHYVVESHDFYYDIVASTVEFKVIKDLKICGRLFERWAEV